MADERGGILYDERGRPYILMPDGRKNFISPAAFGEPVPEDRTGIFRKAPQWDQYGGEYETPFDWGNLVTLATAGGLTAGIGSAALAGGGAAAGGAAGGTLPSATTAPLAGVLPAGGTGLGAGAGLGGIGAGTGGAASTIATGAKAASPLLRAGRLLAGAAPVVGAMTSGNRGQLPPLGTGFQDFLKNNPQFSSLLNNQVNSSNRNESLHKALVDLSMRLLPNSSRGNY